jgi:hypothetical protein
MNSTGILCCLLSAFGAATNPSDAPPSTATLPNQRTVEILIAGPEDARNKMLATIRPLLGPAPDLRWATEERVPTDGALPESSEQGAAQIWIDVSSPIKLRVYLPAAKTKGTTTVRTLARTAADGEDADLLARETAAQIVKAAVLALREGPVQPVADAAALPAGQSTAATVAERRATNAQGARTHDGFYMRIHAGLGYLRASESYDMGTTDSYSGIGPTLNAALGRAIVGNLILYGKFVMTTVSDATWTQNGGPPPGRDLTRDLTLFGFGPGIAYYFAPINLYVSGTLTFAKLWFLDDNNTDSPPPPDTEFGIGGSFTVGKEWWVNRDWGIGVAGQFDYASIRHHFLQERDHYYAVFDPRMQVITLSLVFSVTYN